jgi:hypothetical protein
MKVAFKIAAFLILSSLTIIVNAQKNNTIDIYKSIQRYDLSFLWHADSIQIEGDGENIPSPEPLGFIGDNFQRFCIHLTVVRKNKKNRTQYYVMGKTKINNTIHDFTGTLQVNHAKLYNESVNQNYKQGFLICRLSFYEDSMQVGSGSYQGYLITDFYIDKRKTIHYDALAFATDSFCNNQCETTWTSYTTGIRKKCNWGDYRIPDSKALDCGTGQFAVDWKYIKSGWQNFVKCYGLNHKEAEKAMRLEDRKWWKEDDSQVSVVNN